MARNVKPIGKVQRAVTTVRDAVKQTGLPKTRFAKIGNVVVRLPRSTKRRLAKRRQFTVTVVKGIHKAIPRRSRHSPRRARGSKFGFY